MGIFNVKTFLIKLSYIVVLCSISFKDIEKGLFVWFILRDISHKTSPSNYSDWRYYITSKLLNCMFRPKYYSIDPVVRLWHILLSVSCVAYPLKYVYQELLKICKVPEIYAKKPFPTQEWNTLSTQSGLSCASLALVLFVQFQYSKPKFRTIANFAWVQRLAQKTSASQHRSGPTRPTLLIFEHSLPINKA